MTVFNLQDKDGCPDCHHQVPLWLGFSGLENDGVRVAYRCLVCGFETEDFTPQVDDIIPELCAWSRGDGGQITWFDEVVTERSKQVMPKNTDTWAVVELMGHVTIAGRVTEPREYGGLWQIDIPEGESFRTEFFGTNAVYRVKITSEEIARAYSRPGHEVIEYDAPIVTRAEFEDAMRKARERIMRLDDENSELRRRLVSVNALPSGEE